MYKLILNGNVAGTETSYAKATDTARAIVNREAERLKVRATEVALNKRLYRSPKVRAGVAMEMVRNAESLPSYAKFPKRSGDVSINAPGLTLDIVKG